jgi:hypothetical protein
MILISLHPRRDLENMTAATTGACETGPLYAMVKCEELLSAKTKSAHNLSGAHRDIRSLNS